MWISIRLPPTTRSASMWICSRPIFAVSRVGGWTAHVIEQLDDNRLIRPRADYIGPTYPQKYVPLEKR